MTCAAKLGHRVTLESKTVAKNGFNEQVETWSAFATVWAAVEPISGKEFFGAQQVSSQVTHRVRIRYLEGVTAQMRVRFGARVFEITSPPINPEERNRELQLMCVERGEAS